MTIYQEALRYFLRKTFDLREGEMKRALLMQLNIFLIISTLLIVKSTVQALFVTTYGKESLPLAFVIAAIPAAIISTVYSRVLARLAFNKIIVATLVGSVAMMAILATFLIFDVWTSWAVYVFYIWMTIFALLCTSQFWILANIVFNAREAKRLFGFIGAGAIAGGIFGGYLASALATFMTSESLLFVAAGLLALCIPITRHIWAESVAPMQQHIQQKKRMGGIQEHPILLILHSRHLTYLAIIIGVSVIVAKLVEYQYTAVASEHFTDSEELTSFFGFWLSTLSIISLLVQLFITHRVVGVFGVGTSLFLLPAGILVGAILLLMFPALWAAILIRIADGSLKQSINKSATELLALPIPTDIKNRTKSFIDVFIDCFASGIAGLILIFIVIGLDLDTRAICLIIIALIAVWMYFAYLIRREYIRSFKLRMGESQETATPATPDPGHESVLGGLMRVLESGDEGQIVFVLRKVGELQDKRFFGHIRSLLHHPSPRIRSEALRALYFYKNDPVIEEVEPLIQDDDESVKISAFEYLLEHSRDDRYQRMERYLRDEDYRVSGAALVGLAKETRDNPGLKQRFALEQRRNERLEEIVEEDDPEKFNLMRSDLLKAIGQASCMRLFFVIESAFHDPDPMIVNTAIEAAGKTLHLSFVPPLLEMLADERYFSNARTALLHYGHGIVEPISQLIKEPGTRPDVVRLVPSVLEHIDSQASVDCVLDLLDHEDPTVHIEALRSLNNMRINHPHLRFQKKAIMQRILEEVKLYQSTLSVLYSQKKLRAESLMHVLTPEETAEDVAREALLKLLEARMDGNLERIFRLLGLKYPTEDILPIYEGLQSNKPDLRINAVEFLENLLDGSLKKMLIPVLETALLDGITEEAIQNLDIRIPDEYACYETLLLGKDVKLKMAVLYLIGHTHDQKFMPLLKDYSSSHDQMQIHAYASELRIENQCR
ncbi:MAG: HEAT repeat domain-containing protein [Bacteroidetes bacterium]|nr:HEAT repeat domain-containing protein [Bacteroidota bacterium]